MSKIIMAIHPCYVDEILAGRKKYEYRKTRPQKEHVDTMILYATSPVKKIVAEVVVEAIMEDTVEKVWNETKTQSGITEEFYYRYYKKKTCAIAYQLGKVKKYKKPKDLSEMGIHYAPQSFVYVDETIT